ncbi:restriction endonuclease subunit S [Nitrosomonas halophila]|uniref:Type I restriction enzyme, S subunit n=1 Tax=Nitrosomonas halophila TaxID=44576 RepID=A0A1H3H3G0_9PROT|nr:restriction endonuclease subunit S [Nitrosomonas halophila]SDY10056.1 type I restriction enzyme, S subunit [Nitrosomonas halophila]
MSEWNELPLEQLADISSGGTPSRANPACWGGDIPWVTPSDITACRTNYLCETADFITKKGLSSSSAKLLPKGTLLLTSRATIGDIRISAGPVTTNQGFKNVVANDQIDGNFLFYQLSRLKGSFVRYAAGSTFLEINRKDTGRVLVPYPRSKASQKEIARILQTIDRAIEQTEALIDKYQQIKAGLMHDLFTRGIGPDGQLRPPREQAPHRYQQTPIGWIPKEWEVGKLGNIADLIVGYAFKSTWFRDEGIKLLRGENVGCGRANWSEIRCLPSITAESFEEYLLDEGDVVIGMDRTFTKTGVKISVLGKSDTPSLLVQRVGKFVPVRCRPEYLRWLVVSPSYLQNLVNQQKGMDIPHLSKSEILEPRVPVPTKQEQQLISHMIESVERIIDSENLAYEKLQKQKSGLMHDLLTGKVSVTPDPEPVHG